MALSDEQVGELKKQLLAQIPENLPIDKKKEAKAQVESMSREAIEAMLEQQRSQQPVFRMIVNKQIESVIVKENSEAMAVLEINPLSKGHMLVIPKDAVKEKGKIPISIMEFAKKLGETAKVNLKANKVSVSPGEKFGETIIEIILEYDSPISDNAQRNPVRKEELENVKRVINTEVINKEPELIKKEKFVKKKPISLKRRIP